MTAAVEELFVAVREACTPQQWSRGVELCRAGAVFVDRSESDQAVFRVASGRGPVARTVALFPGDREWDCGCDSPGSACEHVAAAVITWKRASEAGRDVAEAAPTAGRVGYRFRRAEGGLALERVLSTYDGTRPLEGTLTAAAAREPAGASIAVGQADLAVELALGTHRRGLLPREIVGRVFGRLAHCADVELDGRAVRVAAEPVLPSVRVEEQHDGFRVVLVEDPSIEETFGNGVALCAGTLRPLGQAALSGRELHELPRGKRYGPDQVAELVTEVLPSLRRRIAVDVRTERLPETVVETPRVEFETTRAGEKLSVLAVLVYGDPARARVDAGRLLHLHGAVPARDVAAERRVARDLARELQLALGVRAEFSGEQAVELARRLERWQGRAAAGALAWFRLAAPLEARVDVGAGGFAVRFESPRPPGAGAGGAAQADPARVLRAWREGAGLVPLMDGGWAPLPREWLERHGHVVADLLAARDAAGGVLPPSAGADLARLCQDLDQPPPPELAGLAGLVDGFAGVPPAELPADLGATLRQYQREGVSWLVFLRRAGLGALLADDMGLGKTIQALCAVSGRTLVVTPTSVLHNWLDEIRRFRPALDAAVYHGAGRELDARADVTLTTYAILRLDVERLAAERWDTVVLDEAQAIKNPDSLVAAAAYRLEAACRLALTGTPVENRLDELWSQMHFLNRGLLGGRSDFQERYAGPIAAGDAEVARRMRERIRPFVLRRLKQDVAPELPPRTEVVLRCELAPEERALYDAIHAATLDEVVGALGQGGSVLAALEALLRLRQAACHPGLVPGRSAAGSSKLDLLLETLDSVVAERHKAIVFSQWTSLLDLIEPALERAAIAFTRLDGSTRDRAGVVSRFQSASGPPVLLVSLKAGGTGLNLTAADHVFLLDPWWNPAVEDQAADRAHRIGQERPVMVYRLVAEDTVEERILALQEKKRAIAEAALGQAEQAAALTREDLLELLR